MSNIFDLFGMASANIPGHEYKRETSESMIDSVNPRTFPNAGNMNLKNAMTVGSKPKGLSLRPPSDPNICNTNSKATAEKKALLTPTSKTANSYLTTVTSRNKKEKLSKPQILHEKQRKGLSPISKSPHSKFLASKQIEEFKFKKPITPREIKTMKNREPEKLFNYCDEKEFDSPYVLDKGFIGLIASRKSVTPFKDEELTADPVLLNVPSPILVSCIDPKSDSCDENEMSTPEIPIVSDDDSDF